jgi:hypothetical protein
MLDGNQEDQYSIDNCPLKEQAMGKGYSSETKPLTKKSGL